MVTAALVIGWFCGCWLGAWLGKNRATCKGALKSGQWRANLSLMFTLSPCWIVLLSASAVRSKGDLSRTARATPRSSRVKVGMFGCCGGFGQTIDADLASRTTGWPLMVAVPLIRTVPIQGAASAAALRTSVA